MSEYKELIVLSTAKQGLESLAQSSIRSFCLARDLMLPRVSVISFVVDAEPESVPYLGVYKASTGELITYSNELLPCSGMSDEGYRISYKTESVIEVADELGFIFAFYDDIPAQKYYSSPGTVDVVVRNGALLDDTADTVWALSDSVKTPQMPYVELSSGVLYTVEGEIDCTYSYTPFDDVDENGVVIVSVLGNTKFDGSFINTDAGVITYKLDDSEALHSSKTNAVAVRSSMTPNSATDQLEIGRLQNLYIEDGWMPLLTFTLPANWQWDVCSIKPNDRNEYKLCGRISNGTLEWQFGNLVSATTTPATTEAYEKFVYNKETGEWETVSIDPEAGGSSSSTPAEALNGFIETVAYKGGSFNTPVLGWAGEEESKKTMLDANGKLRASCEPVYLGMFNLSMSYLAGIEYNIVNDPDCNQTCDAVDDQYYYEAIQEVSPVWFLFASTKNDLLNLVAIEHKISAGEMDGTWEVPEDVTDSYKLYGPPPKILDKSLDDNPPVSYENFRIWLYTNFILPPESDMVEVTEATNPNLPVGHYYVHTVAGRHYYRIPDELIESGCRSTPSPMWMRAHSVIDTDDDNAVEVPLCAVGEDNSVSVFNNTNKGYRGFIDNVLDHEYRWQRVNNSWAYVPYTASSYVADINKTEGIAFNTQAYLPVGSRYSKSYASYTNYVFRLSSVGRCLKFETANVSDSVGDSIIGDGTYVVSVPGGIEYTSSVFKRIEEAPVDVNSITVTKGSTLAYDTPPKYNIADISVFDGYIGDGNIAVTGAGTANDSEKIVLMDDDISYNTYSLIAPGFILSDRRVVGGAESRVVWYEDGDTTLPSSTYTGTLILQGRNIPAIDLTSFSNVILDQAVIYPIKDSVFGNVTVPNDTVGVIAFPEELKIVIPVLYPQKQPAAIYVTRSIYVTYTVDGVEIAEKFGADINGRTVYAFAQHVDVGYSSKSGVVFGQANGNDVSNVAGLLDNEIPQLKVNLKLTGHSRSYSRYAGIFYPIYVSVAAARPNKLRLSFDVEYPDTPYPISYSVWLPYRADETISGLPDSVCLVENTLLNKDDLHTVVDIDTRYIFYSGETNWVLVLFATDADAASIGAPVYIKNILMEEIVDCNTNSSEDYADYAERLLGVTADSGVGSIRIKSIHVDESGKFAFCSGRHSPITVTALEGTGTIGIGVVPEGYFKDISNTGMLRIANPLPFTGLYYLGEGISQFNISDTYKIYPNEKASLAVRGSSFHITHCFRSNGTVTVAEELASINLSTVILENNSTLSSDTDEIAISADKLVIGNDASVDMITSSTACTTAGSFTVNNIFKSAETVIRGTVIATSEAPLQSKFVVSLYNGLDNFDPVAIGTEVYVTELPTGTTLRPVAGGDVTAVSNKVAYYYAIKGDILDNTANSVVLESKLITTAEEPEGAPVKFFRTVDGSVVFTLPEGYDPLTSTSTDSEPIDEFADIIEGKMDFAVNDRYMDLTTWTDVDRLSRYYVKEVNDPNNTCYDVGSTTLTCCDPIPTDCCETDPSDPSNCNKNCGTPPYPYPDGNINIPEFGDATGGGNENNKDNNEGNAPEGSKLPDWSYPPGSLYISQEQVYVYSVQGALKGTYTEEEVTIEGTRGNSTATFYVPSHSLKLAFDDVVNNAEVQGVGDRTVELEGEMTFPVTFTMNGGSQGYLYYDPSSEFECLYTEMYYGMTSLTSTGTNHLSLGVIYNNYIDGGQKGELTYTGNIKMPIEDIEVVVKISDTFEVGPTQAPESIERELAAMGLRWEKIASEVKTIYSRNTADYARIRFNYISIYPAANFRGRVISNAITSANLKCRGKLRGAIELGSTGEPSGGPTIEATSGISGDVRMWRKDGTGLDQPLGLNTELMVTNYKMADTLITSSESLQNAKWTYCDYEDGLSVIRTARGTASGQIIVEGELLNG